MTQAMSLIGIKSALQHDIEKLEQIIKQWNERAMHYGRWRQYPLMDQCRENSKKAEEQLAITKRLLKSFEA